MDATNEHGPVSNAPTAEDLVTVKQIARVRSAGDLNLLDYGIAASTVFLLVAACYPFRSIIGYQTIALILLLGVTVLPLKVGTGPVILAATVSALAWNFFFIPPAFTFVIDEPQNILMFVTYFVVAAVTGILTARVREREKIVRMREERSTALFTLTKELSAATSLDGVIRAGINNIGKFFNADVMVCLSESDGDMLANPHRLSSLHVDDKEFSVVAWTYWNEKRAGKFTDTLPDAQATYFPLSGPRYPLGVIGVKFMHDTTMTGEQESLIENFIRQIASGLEREQLNELARKNLVIEESERLYKNLFDSLSHEFKTPISTILGSAEQLREERSTTHNDHQDVAYEIYEAASRLNRLVANLLDMARLESGFLKPKLDWCDISDLLNTTVQKLDDDLKNRKIGIQTGKTLPLVKLDSGLMEQVITNLLYNACVHTPKETAIEIEAHAEGPECVLTISDNGPGVPVDIADKIFQKFFRMPGNRTGGTGLGLSIVRGFVEAQGGTVSFQNKKEGGASFTIRIPIVPKIKTEKP